MQEHSEGKLQPQSEGEESEAKRETVKITIELPRGYIDFLKFENKAVLQVGQVRSVPQLVELLVKEKILSDIDLLDSRMVAQAFGLEEDYAKDYPDPNSTPAEKTGKES